MLRIGEGDCDFHRVEDEDGHCVAEVRCEPLSLYMSHGPSPCSSGSLDGLVTYQK